MKKRLKLTALAFSLLFCFPAYADETGFYVNNSYVESETVQNESGVFVPVKSRCGGSRIYCVMEKSLCSYFR